MELPRHVCHRARASSPSAVTAVDVSVRHVAKQGHVALLRLRGDGEQQPWRSAIADALTQHGLIVHDVMMDGIELCSLGPTSCVDIVATQLAAVDPTYELVVLGGLREGGGTSELFVYDLRERALVRRFRFQLRQGDVVLPVVLPLTVGEVVADHIRPPPPPRGDELAELLCWRSDGAQGHGCPLAEPHSRAPLHPLTPPDPSEPHVTWRSHNVAVVMAWSDVRAHLDGLDHGGGSDRDAEYGRIKRAQLQRTIGARRGIEVSSKVRPCAGTRCLGHRVEHDFRMDALVTAIIDQGRAVVFACGQPAVDAVERDAGERWLVFRVPGGPTIVGVRGKDLVYRTTGHAVEEPS
ncbi:MAG: hypothetical protein K0V04_29555 [Deltaproteobacteria bacterium]|nr:hypothetical protein [Deltaproteobacteria bacterium]